MKWKWILALLIAAIVLIGTILIMKPGIQSENHVPSDRQMDQTLIPRQVLFGNPDKASPQISPDGRMISFLAPVNDVLNVWVGPVDDPASAVPVTNDTKRGIRIYFWAYTSNHILYLQDKNGDENWRAYSVSLTTGEKTDLTPVEEMKDSSGL